MQSLNVGLFHVKLAVINDDETVNNPQDRSGNFIFLISPPFLPNVSVSGNKPRDGERQTERKNVFTKSPLKRDPIINIRRDIEMKAACVLPL